MRLTVWRMMVAVATLGLCLGLLRINLALGINAACVAILALLGTFDSLDRRRASGASVSLRFGVMVSMVSASIALAIIGLADLTFLLAYGILSSGVEIGNPFTPPGLIAVPRDSELDPGGFIGGLFGAILVASLLRLALWSRGLSHKSRRLSGAFAALIIAVLLAGYFLSKLHGIFYPVYSHW